MGFRVDPDVIGRLAFGLHGSTAGMAISSPPPEVDAGPSSAAVTALIAELVRAAAGALEITERSSAELHANGSAYAAVDADNERFFHR
ncbi:hypothetical protein [Saccharopolyspora gregorii]|uniref:PE domain-containing protein n=1 Tax=Saccharopolyspora gregorii TaxID=33914 RepID=A0ABP6RKN8_9PSEU|nr:hypothetical protein [Saccharopolyspora gregorii]